MAKSWFAFPRSRSPSLATRPVGAGAALASDRPWPSPRPGLSRSTLANTHHGHNTGHVCSESETAVGNEPRLVPHLVPSLVSLAVILIVFPLTFLVGTSLPPALKVLISLGLASQLCYACLHVAADRRQAYQRLQHKDSPADTPTRTMALAGTYLFRTLLPLLSWLTLFSLLKHMPSDRMAPVDTTTLPRADTWLVGQPAYLYFAPKNDADARVVADVIAWFTYGVWHFVSPVACCLILGVVGLRKRRQQATATDGIKQCMLSESSEEEMVVVWQNDRPMSCGQSFGGRQRTLVAGDSMELAFVASPDVTDVDLDDSDSDSDHTLSEVVISDPTALSMPETARRSIPTIAFTSDPQAPMLSQPNPRVPIRLTLHRAMTRVFVLPSPPTLHTTLVPIHAFLVCFGCMNLCGVMIQYVYPTAPPWYNQHYGSAVPINPLSVRGEPAGLARIDTLFGSPIYKHVFASSPIVFGAWPSLHAGFAAMIALAVSKALWRRRHGSLAAWKLAVPVCRWNGVVGCVATGYVALVWWATMYLCHHFLVDVLAGSAIAVVMFVGVPWVKALTLRSGQPGIQSVCWGDSEHRPPLSGNGEWGRS